MSLFKFVVSKSFLKQLIYAVVLIGLFVFLLAKWLNVSTNHTQRIQVPDLSKLTIEETTVILNELDLRLEVIDSSNYNTSFPPLTVIEQSPEANGFVKEKRTIYLKINRATFKDIQMPDISGKTRRNAEVTLKAVGFIIGDSPLFVRDIAKGVVRGIRSNGKKVNVGDKLPENSIINLTLGDGKGHSK